MRGPSPLGLASLALLGLLLQPDTAHATNGANPFASAGAQGIGEGWLAYPPAAIGGKVRLEGEALRIEGPEFEKARLQIGMVAPDIVGEDLDGVGFKLSDYRGKVVVLDFWGDW